METDGRRIRNLIDKILLGRKFRFEFKNISPSESFTQQVHYSVYKTEPGKVYVSIDSIYIPDHTVDDICDIVLKFMEQISLVERNTFRDVHYQLFKYLPITCVVVDFHWSKK